MRKPNSPASETWTILEKIFAPSVSRAFGVGDSAEVYAVEIYDKIEKLLKLLRLKRL